MSLLEEQNNIMRESWTLTALACDFGFRFRTAMNYRAGVLRINPSVSVRGKSKREFSWADVFKFLCARRLFAAGLRSQEAQGVLNFLDQYAIPEALFSDDIGREWATVTLLIAPVRDSLQRQKVNDYIVTHGYLPMGPHDPIILSSGAIGVEKFREHCATLSNAQWTYALLDLTSVTRELEGRLDAIAHNRDYKKIISAGDQTLAAVLVEHAYRPNRLTDGAKRLSIEEMKAAMTVAGQVRGVIESVN